MSSLMGTVDCFKEIEVDFGTAIAIGVIQIRTLIVTAKVKDSEVNTGDSFTTRMKKKSKSLLWEMTDEEFDLCWKVVEVLPTWHIGRELFGLGGSRVMRLKDLVDGRPMTFKTEDI